MISGIMMRSNELVSKCSGGSVITSLLDSNSSTSGLCCGLEMLEVCWCGVRWWLWDWRCF